MTTKQKILEKAIMLFNDLGLNEVGVRDIARALDMSPGNLSYHFPKKDDLVVALMDQLKANNNLAYATYEASPKGLTAFMHLLQQIFQNQYAYKAITLGGAFSSPQFQGPREDYVLREQGRRIQFNQIVEDFVQAGQLRALSDEEKSTLVSYITFMGRFWLMEAELSYTGMSSQDKIRHYLFLLGNIFSFYATPNGKQALKQFFDGENAENL